MGLHLYYRCNSVNAVYRAAKRGFFKGGFHLINGRGARGVQSSKGRGTSIVGPNFKKIYSVGQGGSDSGKGRGLCLKFMLLT